MRRREFIRSAGGLVLLAGAMPWPQALAALNQTITSSKRPLNLLFITVDDMNGSMPGWMGNPLKLTPNMDAFVESCHRFSSNHDSAPICMPSREAMMSGLCPNRSGGYGFNPINEGVPTLVTVLQAQGYFAGGIDKLGHMRPKSCFPWDASVEDGGKNPQLFGDEVTRFIEIAKAADKPFFINVNIKDPHRPLYNAARGNKTGPAGSPVEVVAKLITPEQAKPPSFLEDLPEVRQDYADYSNSVQRADLSFGKVIASVQAAGELDRTVVVFVSDHGMPFPLAKATCYYNGSWCPVFLRWPGMPEGRTHDCITSSLDLMPTLLDILNIPAPAQQDGLSWLPWLHSGGKPARDYAISNVNGVSSGLEFPQRSVTTKTGAFMVNLWADGTNRLRVNSMSSPSFKAMKTAAATDARIAARVKQYVEGYPLAYYDLTRDPDQRVNVLSDPKYAGEVKRLQQILLNYMETTKDPQLENYQTLLAGGTVHIDPKAGRKNGHKEAGADAEGENG